MALALLLLGALFTVCSAYPSGSVGDFIRANADTLSVMQVLIDKAELADDFSYSGSRGTFFIPSNYAFVDSFQYVPPFSEAGAPPTVADIMAAVKNANVSAAQEFLLTLLANETFSSVSELLNAGEFATRATNASLQVDGSLDTAVIVYRMDPIVDDTYGLGAIQGPVVYTASDGKAAIYVVNGLLAAPYWITIGTEPLPSVPDAKPYK